MDWAAHFKHLQTVLREFDADAVILEPVLIRLFRNGLKPSIHAQAKQKGRQKKTPGTRPSRSLSRLRPRLP